MAAAKDNKILIKISKTLCFIACALLAFHHISSWAGSECNSLPGFVHNVIQNNTSVRAARANVKAAEARYVASSQPLYNPELTALAEKGVEKTYSVGINQTIDIANKRCAKSKIGEADLQVARMQLVTLEQQLTADLLNALITFHTQTQVVRLAQERTSILQRFFTLTKY